MLNIGLVCVGYQCRNVRGVITPWILFKEKSKDINLNIVWVSALFDQFSNQEYENESNSKILSELDSLKWLKFIEVKDRKIKDYESRVEGWNYLRQFQTDYIFQLDGDEFYTEKDIENIFSFISKNEYVDTFRINFKNYFGPVERNQYIDDFKPLRVISNNSNGGFKNFTWDNDGVFNNYKRTQEASCVIIPKARAFVRHDSWNYWDEESKRRVENKVKFQMKTLGVCSYKFLNDELVIDDDYYSRFNLPKPLIYKDI